MGGLCLSRRDWRKIGMVLAGEPQRFFSIANKTVPPFLMISHIVIMDHGLLSSFDAQSVRARSSFIASFSSSIDFPIFGAQFSRLGG